MITNLAGLVSYQGPWRCGSQAGIRPKAVRTLDIERSVVVWVSQCTRFSTEDGHTHRKTWGERWK